MKVDIEYFVGPEEYTAEITTFNDFAVLRIYFPEQDLVFYFDDEEAAVAFRNTIGSCRTVPPQ